MGSTPLPTLEKSLKLNFEHFDVECVAAAEDPGPGACGDENLLYNYPGPGFLRLRWAEWCGLSRSIKTVSRQKNDAMVKLGLKNDLDIFVYASEHGLTS